MFAAIRREYRSLPAAFWSLWLGTLINKAGGFVVPFLALYVAKRGGDDTQAGIVMALYGAGAIVAGITGGLLADHIGRRATMIMSLLGGAAPMLAVAMSRDFVAIGTSTFLMGWIVELYRPAVAAATADLVPPADRPRAYGHLYWANNLGFAIAPTVGGLLASFNYAALFVVDAVTLAAYGVLVLLRVPETRPLTSPMTADAAKRRGRGLLLAVTDRTFGWFLLLMLGLTLVMWQDRSTLPLDMRRHGISEVTYGAIVSINGVLIVLFQPSVTRAVSVHSRTAVLAWSSLLFALGFGTCGLVSSPLGYAMAIVIWTFGEMAAIPTASSVVADLAPSDMRGRYQGLYAMTFGAASCLGPLLGVAVLQHAGGRALWFGCFTLMLVVVGGHIVLAPARAARELGHE